MEEPPITFTTPRVKCTHQLTAMDVPRGLDPDDFVAPCGDACPAKETKKKAKGKRSKGR